jgi:hypothetical protein
VLHHTHSREAEGRGFEIDRTLFRPQKSMAPTRFPAPESDLPHDGTYQLNVLSARRPRGNQDSCADLSAIISHVSSEPKRTRQLGRVPLIRRPLCETCREPNCHVSDGQKAVGHSRQIKIMTLALNRIVRTLDCIFSLGKSDLAQLYEGRRVPKQNCLCPEGMDHKPQGLAKA